MYGTVWIWEMALFIHWLHLEFGHRICGLPGRLIPRLHLKSQLPRSILDEAIRRLELPDSRSEGREGSLQLRITPLQSFLRPFEFLHAGAQLSFCSAETTPRQFQHISQISNRGKSSPDRCNGQNLFPPSLAPHPPSITFSLQLAIPVAEPPLAPRQLLTTSPQLRIFHAEIGHPLFQRRQKLFLLLVLSCSMVEGSGFRVKCLNAPSLGPSVGKTWTVFSRSISLNLLLR